MRIPYFQVNAFTTDPFGGNPAGVCVLQNWLPDKLLQQIATENGFSETAFLVPQNRHFDLRWMTPLVEVDLCGHATLASAFVLFSEFGFKQDPILFQTRSGRLSAARRGNLVELDFPSRPPESCDTPEQLVRGLGAKPSETFKSRDYVAVFNTAEEVISLCPDFAILVGLDCLGIIVTAKDGKADFVSRFFAPRAGVDEDPVTGSAHCSLIPFWAERLGKSELIAKQVSKRGGELHCRNLGERVGIAGHAVVYCRGEIEVGVKNEPRS
jgi:predicted PhzF superfamily epimerase YddE/YHI9